MPPDSDTDGESDRREFFQASASGLGLTFAPGTLATETAPQPPVAAQALGVGQPIAVQLNVNGTNHALKIEPRVTLLDALRELLHLTGSKKGCDHGQCGACTVLVDGRRANACLLLAVATAGCKIQTVEGLANGEKLHPLQLAFIKHDAFQCGYCTPGQLCSAAGLLNEGHAKTDDDVREEMSGNVCRCGAYPNILAAIREVQQAAPKEKP